jgi:hypothetical protein
MLIKYRWDGEVMRPEPYWRKRAVEGFEAGKVYDLVEVHNRNMLAHRRFFAIMNEVFENLPEGGPQFPDAETLRKHLLTFTEFCTVHVYEARSLAEAMRHAVYLKKDERYSRIKIMDNNSVWQWVPNSQAVDAMPDNRTFRKSCDAVLDAAAKELGVSVEELNAARSA